LKLIRLAAALLALLSFAANADPVTLSWQHDGKNTDGTPATLAGFRIYYGSSATLDHTIEVANGALRTYVVTNLAPATWRFAVTAYDTAGHESLLSNTAIRVVLDPLPPPTPVPAAPENLVAAGRTVFVIKQTADNISLVAVGTVPSTTQCVATNGVFANGKSYFRVPAAAVAWSGSVRSVVVLADCS